MRLYSNDGIKRLKKDVAMDYMLSVLKGVIYLSNEKGVPVCGEFIENDALILYTDVRRILTDKVLEIVEKGV